jgi:hypothetical protein
MAGSLQSAIDAIDAIDARALATFCRQFLALHDRGR